MEQITERFICIFIITTIVTSTIGRIQDFAREGGGEGEAQGHLITRYYTSGTTSIDVDLYHKGAVAHG